MKRIGCTLTVLLSCFVYVGCGGSSDESADSKSGDQKSGHEEQTTEVVSASHADTSSPASADESVISGDASPEEIVVAFLEAVRSGDERSATLLLTDKARYETEKENLTPHPPGTPNAQYDVHTAQYTTANRDGAHVKSLWKQTDGEGISETYEITWVLKYQPQSGWRVSGMTTPVIEGEPPVFFNFENPREMLEKWEMANQMVADHEAANGVRQAQQPPIDSGQTVPR